MISNIMQTKHLRAAVLIALAVCTAHATLAQTKPQPKVDPSTLKEEGKKLFGGGPPSQPDAKPGEGGPKSGGWSILLAVFRRDSAPQDAATLLSEIQTRGQLPQAY